MAPQNSIDLSSLSSNKNQNSTFRTVHYLGSKLRILDFIKSVADEVDPQKNGICDLFSGSGSVSQHFSSERKVVSVDIQQYSSVICSALLKPMNDEFVYEFVQMVKACKKTQGYINVFLPVIELEEKIINGDLSDDLNLVCDFLENASLYSAIQENNTGGTSSIKTALAKVIVNLKNHSERSFLASRYFGGVYFSYKQAVELDVIIDNIKDVDSKYKNILLASVLSTASDIVNTVGKQFAQPIRPRDKSGSPKKGILKQLRRDRNLDVFSVFESWVNKYAQVTALIDNHEVLCMDYKDALDGLGEDTGIVYADPPYTRDHYSRFYHGLETLCMMDFPLVSTTNIGGFKKLSRGLYREERHQSDFCIRSKAPQAFEELFEKVSRKGKTLLLSYSPYDKKKGAHPRVVEMELLESLAKKYFSFVEIRSPGKFSHSKLNRTNLHLDTEDIAEVLIVCKN